MWSNSAPAIRAERLSKCYHLYDRPADRLRQLLWGHRRRYYREFWALREASFAVGRGEVWGIMGRNGAGKSTLLQLACGTLTATSGMIAVNGRVAALLELGAGFNPEFSGRENVLLAASILGLGKTEIDARYEEIVDYSGIREFIDQPVKFYSTGMSMRLAFAVATSVDPDILVIDEALSVGDGEFARKSFDRIMRLKEAGKTILFCSHSLFQMESLCTHALWLHQGRIQAAGEPAKVVVAYQEFLDRLHQTDEPAAPPADQLVSRPAAPQGHARLLGAVAVVNGAPARTAQIASGVTDLVLKVDFGSDPALPAPTVGVTLHSSDGRVVTASGSWIDGIELTREPHGFGSTTLTYPRLPLLKGNYTVSFFLLCERGLHLYDGAMHAVSLEVSQTTLELGLVTLPHRWEAAAIERVHPLPEEGGESGAI